MTNSRFARGLNAGILEYKARWNSFVDLRTQVAFFRALKPVAVTWRADSLSYLNACLMDVRNVATQLHMVKQDDDRWVATVFLPPDVMAWGLRVFRIVQRPSPGEPNGVQHVDFTVPSIFATPGRAARILGAEPGMHWEEERNDDSWWYSLKFAHTEARVCVPDQLPPGACIRQLQEVQDAVLDAVS